MRAVSAREANQSFAKVLSRAEAGEEVVITRRGRPVAVLAPYRAPAMTPEREAAIERAKRMMEKGLPWGRAFRRFTRDEMHER
ncbi:MAG TPA: type II toxin-antitoxin system prevent-host-death family antitoxin [Alphaproteobacteria bacterium]|nr:type II toxin-antitoxin system prevent-host-death family antitoxin [Alphaproteobacteria bacterium]